MKWALACPLALLACGAAEAVHVPMMGVPQQLSFHYLTSERVSRESAPATLLTATEASVLASVNPSTGQISWRQQLEGLQGFDALGERVCTWQEHKLACFEAATGYLIWDYALPSTEKAQGVKVIQDAVQAWTDSHFHLFSLSGQLLQSSEAVGVQGTLSSNNKAVLQDPASTRLSLLDVSDPTNSPSELSPGQDDYLILDHGIVTLKKGSMQPFCPDPSNPKKLHGKALKSSFTYTSIQRMSGQHLLGLHSEGQAEVVQLTDDCQLEVLNNFKDAAPDAQYSPSIDRNGELHVARLAYSPNLHLGLVTIYSSVKSDWGDKGYIQGSTLPLNEKKHGPLLSFVTEVAPPDKSSGKPQTISRSVWVSSSGQVASCFGGAQSPAWVREEGLAALSSEVQPVWLDVSKERLSHAIPSSESIVGQAIRYLELMREYTFSLFPQLWRYIFHVPVIHADNGLDPLTAQFGFKKLAIVPSQKGSVFALDLMTRGPPLDLGNTHIVWNTHLDTAGAGIQWKQMVLDDNKVLLLGIKVSLPRTKDISRSFGLCLGWSRSEW